MYQINKNQNIQQILSKQLPLHITHRHEHADTLTMRHSYTNNKAVFLHHRNCKSLKILNAHLNDYRIKDQNKSGIKFVEKVVREKSREGSKSIQKEKAKFDNKMVAKIFLDLSDQKFKEKACVLIDNLLISLNIFKKVFANSRRKRTIISKLYGWDDSFNQVFFMKHGEVLFSQDFKPQITKQSIIESLGFDKRTKQTQNIYNKLRLFLAEITNKNIEHQQLESANKKQKLLSSCTKLRSSIERLSHDSNASKKTLKQVQSMKQTHSDMLKMKMRIKNRGDDLQKLSRLTGTINVNPFYLKEEQNVDSIQDFIRRNIV